MTQVAPLLQTGPWGAQLQPLLVDATAILDAGRGCCSCQSNWLWVWAKVNATQENTTASAVSKWETRDETTTREEREKREREERGVWKRVEENELFLQQQANSQLLSSLASSSLLFSTLSLYEILYNIFRNFFSFFFSLLIFHSLFLPRTRIAPLAFVV